MADEGREEMSAPAPCEALGGQGPPGTVTLLTTTSCTRLILSGDVDVSMNAELSHAVEAAAQRGLSIEVHTQEVTSMDTSVIGMLAHLAMIVDRPLRFITPPQAVRSLLDTTGITEMVEILGRDPGLSPGTGPAVTPN